MHPVLTLTGLYNVLEKLRTGAALTVQDKEIHAKGLVSILKQIHDDLDAAVLESYGWSDLPKGGTGGPPVISSAHGQAARAPLDGAEALEQQLLCRLVALNHERAAEEKRKTKGVNLASKGSCDGLHRECDFRAAVRRDF